MASLTAFIPACSTTEKAAANAGKLVAESEQFAQSPSGQLVLTAVVDGVDAYVASSGGAKSRANAANLATAVRALETGQIPPVSLVASTIQTYTGSSSVPSRVVSAIVAGAASAPSPQIGMEAVATKLDSISAQ